MVNEKIKLLYRAWKYRLRDDREEIAFLLRFLKKGDTALDVGAHKGGYTWWMQQAVGPTGKVVAFEPQIHGAALLKDLFTANNITVEHMAVSDREAVQQLYIQPQSYDISFEASLENKYDNPRLETVRTTSIDAYCFAHELAPALIKIDVEGAETKVIEGAREVLHRYSPLVMVEAEVRHIGIGQLKLLFSSLKHQGYHGCFFVSGKRLPVTKFEAALHQREQNIGSSKYANNFIFEKTA